MYEAEPAGADRRALRHRRRSDAEPAGSDLGSRRPRRDARRQRHPRTLARFSLKTRENSLLMSHHRGCGQEGRDREIDHRREPGSGIHGHGTNRDGARRGPAAQPRGVGRAGQGHPLHLRRESEPRQRRRTADPGPQRQEVLRHRPDRHAAWHAGDRLRGRPAGRPRPAAVRPVAAGPVRAEGGAGALPEGAGRAAFEEAAHPLCPVQGAHEHQPRKGTSPHH